MIRTFNMDCMEFMKDIPDKYYDLACVDPPYGINADVKNSTDKKQSKKSAKRSKNYGNQNWDSEVPTEEYFKELFRVSKNQIIWGVNYYPYTFLTGGRLYWDKCVTMPTYSDGELAYCSFLNSIKCVKIAWHGMIQSDMKNKEIRIHPTQKPVALYKWILNEWNLRGMKVLDTHGGSFSQAIACHDYEVDLDIMEIDPKYYENGCLRLRQHQSQTKLF